MLKFDHIIHYVDDLEKVRKSAPLPIHSGGVHQKFGTENLLSYFDFRYVEFLSIKDMDLYKKHLAVEKDSFVKTINDFDYREGFIRYAISTDDIVSLTERFHEKGYETIGPVDMERETGGEPIRWQLMYVVSDEVFPFFIEWEDTVSVRLARIPELDVSHPEITIHQAVTDLHAWESFYEVLGLWQGKLDEYTSIQLTEKESPAMILEIDQSGDSGIFKGADYKFT